jgi:hypothetical protein
VDDLEIWEIQLSFDVHTKVTRSIKTVRKMKFHKSQMIFPLVYMKKLPNHSRVVEKSSNIFNE